MAEDSPHLNGTSRLLELLRRIGREEPGAIGFGRPRQGPTRRAALALAAAVPSDTVDTIQAARAAGADAVFVPVSTNTVPTSGPSNRDSAPLCGIAQTQPITPEDLDGWRNTGIDAVAVPPRAALAACYSARRPGLFALVDQHAPFDELRAAAGLAVEGFLLRDIEDAGRLGGQDLGWLTLAAGLVRGPALLLSSRVVAEDLEALVTAGLNGVVVRLPADGGEGHIQSVLGPLRTAVNGLDPHLREKGQDRAGLGPVTIPSSGGRG